MNTTLEIEKSETGHFVFKFILYSFNFSLKYNDIFRICVTLVTFLGFSTNTVEISEMEFSKKDCLLVIISLEKYSLINLLLQENNLLSATNLLLYKYFLLKKE